MKVQIIAEGASYYKNGKFEILSLGIHDVPNEEAQDFIKKKYAVLPPSFGISLKEDEDALSLAQDENKTEPSSKNTSQPRTPMPNKK